MIECDPGAVEFIRKHFFDCVYTTKDTTGFVLGLTSLVLWITAQLPQFIENIRNQSAEGLSVWFLAQWFLGDTLNLLGCLMSGQQLATTTALAMYFVLSDVMMLTQFVYYGALNKRKAILEQKVQRRSMMIRQSQIHRGQQGLTHGRNRAATAMLPDASSPGGNFPGNLRPRVLSEFDTAHAAAYLHHQHQQPAQHIQSQHAQQAPASLAGHTWATSLIPAPQAHSQTHTDGRHVGVDSEAQVTTAVKPVAGSSTTRAVIAGAASVASILSLTAACVGPGLYLPWTTQAQTHSSTVLSGVHGQAVYSDGITYGAPAVIPDHTQHHYVGGYREGHDTGGIPWYADVDQLLAFLGAVFGYCSMFLYLSSRVSQIMKNHERKSADGLSVTMFLFTMSANICTGCSILLRLKSSAAFHAQLPWICGAFGTVGLDGFIFHQARKYNAQPHSPKPARISAVLPHLNAHQRAALSALQPARPSLAAHAVTPGSSGRHSAISVMPDKLKDLATAHDVKQPLLSTLVE